MPNAIAFNSIQFNLARVIGPLLAGGARSAAFGMVACFGLNGLSFLAVIVAILMLHVRHIAADHGDAHARGAHERPRRTSAPIRRSSACACWASPTTFLGNPLLTFLPLFAQNVFHGGVGAVHAS